MNKSHNLIVFRYFHLFNFKDILKGDAFSKLFICFDIFRLKVIENCPVTNILTEGHTFDTKKVIGVETKYGTIKTKNVVNCTGAWGNDIANMVSKRNTMPKRNLSN